MSEFLSTSNEATQYFYIDLPKNDSLSNQILWKRQRYCYVIDSNVRFPLQFGLEVYFGILLFLFFDYIMKVVSSVLGDPAKAHWKNCLLSDDDERSLADRCREAFSPFDFTLG